MIAALGHGKQRRKHETLMWLKIRHSYLSQLRRFESGVKSKQGRCSRLHNGTLLVVLCNFFLMNQEGNAGKLVCLPLVELRFKVTGLRLFKHQFRVENLA